MWHFLIAVELLRKLMRKIDVEGQRIAASAEIRIPGLCIIITYGYKRGCTFWKRSKDSLSSSLRWPVFSASSKCGTNERVNARELDAAPNKRPPYKAATLTTVEP